MTRNRNTISRTTEEMVRYLTENVEVTEAGCRLWKGPLNRDGYVRIKWRQEYWLGHRLAFELMVGPIPDGMTLDHLCHVRDPFCAAGRCAHRSCVNPAHLEPVTAVENHRRAKATRAACKNGHPYERPVGRHRCEVCHRATQDRRNARRRGTRRRTPERAS